MTVPDPSLPDPAPAPQSMGEADLVVTLEGFSGPIDLLLQLARDNKLDIAGMSMLQLAEQYLSYIVAARRLRLDIAADYLVMAAWLAYLKSRLLLPETKGEEPRGEDMAEALAFQLRRLEAMQEAGVRLLARPQLGTHFFAAQAAGPDAGQKKIQWTLKLYDLLDGVAAPARRRQPPAMQFRAQPLYSLHEARRRILLLMTSLPGWRGLSDFLPEELSDLVFSRSALAGTLVAALELAKEGQLEVQQPEALGQIFIRARTTPRPEELSPETADRNDANG